MSLRPFKFANDATNTGAIKQFSKPERQYLAYRTGKYLTNMVEGDPSTLTITPTATTVNVGTYVDTIYNPDVPSEFPRTRSRTYYGKANSSDDVNKFSYVNPVTLPSLVYTDDTVEITVTVDCSETQNRFDEIQSSISFNASASNYNIDSIVTSPTATTIDDLSVSWENFSTGLTPQQYSVTYTLSFTNIGYMLVSISSSALDSNNVQPTSTDIYSSFIRVERSDSPGLSEIQTSIYQENMVTPLEDGENKRYPIYYDVYRRGLKESNNVELDNMTVGVLNNMMEDELPGTYRLSADSPGDDWQIYLENVFIDTRYDGSSTAYSIWLRTEYETIPVRTNPLVVRRAGPNNRFDGLQAMNDEQIDFTFGERAKRIIMESGVGTYQLRSSEQGAPTDAGTWVARGVAIDTRLTFRADEGYTGFVDYERTYDSTYIGDTIYEGDYEGTYLVEYETEYESTYSTEYETAFQLQYTGNYSTDYEGLYETGYLNEYSVEYLQEYGAIDFEAFDGYEPDRELYQAEYEGIIDIENYNADYDGSPAEYVATYNVDYSGDYQTDYIGGYERDDFEFYSGVYIGDYLTEFEAYDGEYIGTFEITNYNTEFLTYEVFGGEYIGTYDGEYIGTFEIANYNTEFLTYAVFGGEYIGTFEGETYTTDFLSYAEFAGQYLGTDFEEFSITNYTGFESFSGDIITTDFEFFESTPYQGFESFTGSYTGTDFESFSVSNYQSFETFTGEYIGTYNSPAGPVVLTGTVNPRGSAINNTQNTTNNPTAKGYFTSQSGSAITINSTGTITQNPWSSLGNVLCFYSQQFFVGKSKSMKHRIVLVLSGTHPQNAFTNITIGGIGSWINVFETANAQYATGSGLGQNLYAFGGTGLTGTEWVWTSGNTNSGFQGPLGTGDNLNAWTDLMDAGTTSRSWTVEYP